MTTTNGALDLWRHYQPHAAQQAIHDIPAPRKAGEAGRRFGKSRVGLFECLKVYGEALYTPVDESLVPPFHAWCVFPTFPQARQSWNEAMAFIPPEILQSQPKQDEHLIYLKGSAARAWGLIEFKSADNAAALQTVGLDYLWVSEAQDIADDAWYKLLPTLRSPNRMSRAYVEGIPSTHSMHWFRRLVDAAKRDGKDWASFHYSAFDNPLLTPADRQAIEHDRELLPDRVWRRMYLAEFNEDSGYFNNITACISGDLIPSPIPGVRYVAGLDLGRKHDASVLWIADAAERRLVAHYVWDAGQNWVVQRESIAHHAKTWNVENLLLDATGTGGDMFEQELSEMGIPATPYVINAQSREHLLNNLAISFERMTVRIPHEPRLLRELRSFQYRRLPGGGWKAEAAAGEHDDEVFAAGLALLACDPAPTNTTTASRWKPFSYLPKDGVPDGPTHEMARRMAERRSERLRLAAEMSGVKLS